MNRGGRPPKLTREQSAALQRLHSTGASKISLARQWGLAQATVRRYINGECRQHRTAVS